MNNFLCVITSSGISVSFVYVCLPNHANEHSGTCLVIKCFLETKLIKNYHTKQSQRHAFYL